MVKRISATEAKNNFGGLLEEVAVLGCVEIVKHGRLVAVVLSPRAYETAARAPRAGSEERQPSTHMIPSRLARAARMVRPPVGFDD
jgi:prevent-host-death family protein